MSYTPCLRHVRLISYLLDELPQNGPYSRSAPLQAAWHGDSARNPKVFFVRKADLGMIYAMPGSVYPDTVIIRCVLPFGSLLSSKPHRGILDSRHSGGKTPPVQLRAVIV